MQLGESIGKWAVILAGIFSLFALLTTFWSNTLALRDVVHEQVGIGNRVSWLIATVPCILFAIGTLPFQILMVVSTIVSAIGALIPLS